MDILIYYSLFFTALTILIYWFGMSCNSRSSNVNKEVIYKDGSIFFLRFVIIPAAIFSVVYVSFRKYSYFKLILTAIANTSILFMIIIAVTFILYFATVFQKPGTDYEKYTTLVFGNNSSTSFKLHMFSFLTVCIVAATIAVTLLENPIDKIRYYSFSFVSLIFLLVVLTLIALLDGLLVRVYKKVVITTKKNTEMEGFLLNKGEFVSLHTKDSIENINRDCIYKISEEHDLYNYNIDSLILERNNNLIHYLKKVVFRR